MSKAYQFLLEKMAGNVRRQDVEDVTNRLPIQFIRIAPGGEGATKDAVVVPVFNVDFFEDRGDRLEIHLKTGRVLYYHYKQDHMTHGHGLIDAIRDQAKAGNGR